MRKWHLEKKWAAIFGQRRQIAHNLYISTLLFNWVLAARDKWQRNGASLMQIDIWKHYWCILHAVLGCYVSSEGRRPFVWSIKLYINTNSRQRACARYVDILLVFSCSCIPTNERFLQGFYRSYIWKLTLGFCITERCEFMLLTL
jgi:hypothetical protein